MVRALLTKTAEANALNAEAAALTAEATVERMRSEGLGWCAVSDVLVAQEVAIFIASAEMFRAHAKRWRDLAAGIREAANGGGVFAEPELPPLSPSLEAGIKALAAQIAGAKKGEP